MHLFMSYANVAAIPLDLIVRKHPEALVYLYIISCTYPIIRYIAFNAKEMSK